MEGKISNETYALSGPRAQNASDWNHTFAALGWEDEGDPPVGYGIDAITRDSWTVARVWSSACHMRFGSRQGVTHRLIVGVDGTGTVQIESGELYAVAPRTMVLAEANSSLVLSNHGIWARYEWLLQTRILNLPPASSHLNRLVTPTAPYYELIAALTNTLVGSESHMTAGPKLMTPVLLSTIVSALHDATSESGALSSAQAAVYADAVECIDRHYQNASFDTRGLADLIAVSPTYLHRVFRAAGTTPRRAIEARRLSAALTLLEATPSSRQGLRTSVAVRSGFSSTTQMRRALARHLPEPDVAETEQNVHH